jgi:site-specific DNA-cytosine methylase
LNVAHHSQCYLSLFAGAAGLDLSIRIAVPNARCVGYVENDAATARILAARMADGTLDAAPVWSDVRSVPCDIYRGRVDGIIGGFPCTDLSVAGKREGITGERSGLWFEYARIIREVQPGWVFIENVPPVLHLGAGRAVLGELAGLGFDAVWDSVRASDVGAPHQRKRVFIFAWNVADRESGRLTGLRESLWRSGFSGGAVRGWSTPSLGMIGVDRATAPALESDLKSHQRHLVHDAVLWSTPYNFGGGRADHIAAGKGGMDLKSQTEQMWTTPQAHDTHPGKADRVGRFNGLAGGANLTDDVMAWNDGE